MDEVPAPLLEPGSTYLLFLVPGEVEGQYFVTGGDAGLYRAAFEVDADGSQVACPVAEGDSRFTRLAHEKQDVLLEHLDTLGGRLTAA